VTDQDVEPGWFNYMFKTGLDCPNRCGPGAHPLYVGKSNDSLRRLLEHAKDKSWFKHVTGWEIYPERYATEEESLAAELQRIRGLRPLANDQHNRDNPCRMEFAPTVGRQPVARRGLRAQAGRRVLPVPPWYRTSDRARVAAWGVAGSGMSVLAGWWAACVYAHVGWVAGLWASAGGVVALLFACWALTFRKRSRVRPVLMFCAVMAGLASLWGLAGMPAAAQLPAPAPSTPVVVNQR
jgi:FAD/FMN-containing dehydrogenase